MSEQRDNIERVASKISSKVLEFCRLRPRTDPQFHMQDLTAYVQAQVGVAPDSPGRILRLLRQAGKINYTVVDRANSIYQLESRRKTPAQSQLTLFGGQRREARQ